MIRFTHLFCLLLLMLSACQAESDTTSQPIDQKEVDPPVSELVANSESETLKVDSQKKAEFAILEDIQGRVFLQKFTDVAKKSKAKPEQALDPKDTLITLSDAMAKIKFADGTEVIMDQRTRLTLRSANEFFQESGISYYDVQKRREGDHLNVRTGFALIGVKGTEFIVSVNNEETDDPTGMLSLKEGSLDIQNPDGEDFEHHFFKIKDEEPMSEYERYQAEMMGNFEAYKKRLVEEFVSYKKSFSLEAGRQLHFNGKRVDDKQMDQDKKDLFEYFERLK